jgi:hypothetical protein
VHRNLVEHCGHLPAPEKDKVRYQKGIRCEGCLTHLVVFSNFTHKIAECLVDVDALLGGSLYKLAAEMLGKVTALYQKWRRKSVVRSGLRRSRKRTVHADLPLVFEITFVCNDDDRERVLVFYSEDLLMERAYFLEGVARGEGVDKEEAFACAHVLFTHSAGE